MQYMVRNKGDAYLWSAINLIGEESFHDKHAYEYSNEAVKIKWSKYVIQ